MPEWDLLMIIPPKLDLQEMAIVGQQEKAAVVIVPQIGLAGLLLPTLDNLAKFLWNLWS